MYYFIINPKSRTGMGAEVWQQVQAKIKQKKLPYRHFFTEYRGHATKLTKSICSQASPGDCLTVIGGDGTIRKCLPESPSIPRYFLPTFLPDPEMTLPEVWRFQKIRKKP